MGVVKAKKFNVVIVVTAADPAFHASG